MRNKLYLLIFIAAIFQVLSCKKDSQPQQQKQIWQQGKTALEKGLVNFSINGELLAAAIDTMSNIITIVIPDSVSKQKLAVSYTLASQVSATINNQAANNGGVYDFSKPVVFTVTSADKQRSTSFQVNVESKMEYIGLAGALTAQKSLNKNYDFYFDQIDGSTFQEVNCGPAVASMAIKWADSTSTLTPAYVRTQVLPSGELWPLAELKIYIAGYNHINAEVHPLSNIDSLVKTNIDNNQLVIFMVNIWDIPYNNILYQHVSKFYDSGISGHFILVKGYKIVGGTFYFEVYDPYSNGVRYTGLDYTQLKGIDRYYIDSDVNRAAMDIEPNVLIVAPKGKKII